MRDMVPWRWGGLRRFRRDEEPQGNLQQRMDSLHAEMDRLFEGLLDESWLRSMGSRGGTREQLMPFIDETEDDKAFHVSVELPGMDEKDVDITLTDRRLTIRGEKKQEDEHKGKDFYRRERSYGSFRRTIDLPGDVDASAIDASFKSGVLTIELPKTKEAQAKVRHIAVKAA